MTPSRNFDEGTAQRMNKQMVLETTCMGREEISFSVIIFRRTLSSDVLQGDALQPEVEFLHS